MSPQELRAGLLDKLYCTLKERRSALVSSSEPTWSGHELLGRVDLAGALALLSEATLALGCFAQIQNLNESDDSADLIAQLNCQIKSYETERAKLHAELQQMEHFARSSWTSYKAAEAELNQLKSAISEHLPEPS